MNHHLQAWWTLSALWALMACEAPASQTAQFTTRDSAGIRIVENTGPSWPTPWHVDPKPVLSIGSAGERPDQTLDQVTAAMKLANGEIVVANGGSLELLVYDGNGRLLRRVGRRGGGPGEFMSLEWLSRYRGDSILAVDVSNQRVSYFDASGEFGRSIRLVSNAELPYPRPVGVFADGSFAALRGLYVLGARPPIRVVRPPETLFHVGADGASVTKILTFLGRESVIGPSGPGGSFERRGRPFGRETAFAAAGDRLYVGDNESYDIRVYSVAGQLQEIIRSRNPARAITAADVRAFQDSILRDAKGPESRQMRVFIDQLPPHPEAYPAFAGKLHIDVRGCLWVRESAAPGSRVSAWDVFTDQGVLLGTVEIGARVTILDIGADFILALRRDELDVEYVEEYRLSRSP